MIANAKTLRQGEVSLRRESNGMEASLLPRKNYASAISDRLNVDPSEQGGEEFHRITKPHSRWFIAGMVSSCVLAAAAGESANRLMRSLLLRVSYPMLKDLIAASHTIYAPMRAQYNVTQHQWVFPSGAIIEFGAIENTEACIMNYSGRSFSFIGVDEIVQLGGDTVDATGQPINGAYSFLKSRLRAVEGSGTGGAGSGRAGGADRRPGYDALPGEERSGTVDHPLGGLASPHQTGAGRPGRSGALHRPCQDGGPRNRKDGAILGGAGRATS